MQIHHFISSIDKIAGGPSLSTTNLIEGIVKDPNTKVTLHTGYSLSPVVLEFFNRNATLQFYKMKRFGRIELNSNLRITTKQTLFHGHGLWDFIIHQMSMYARKKKIAYIISPRGMLAPWALEQSKYIKKLALTIYQYSDLKYATCLHATSMTEAINIRSQGLNNPIALIPNGIDLSQITPKYNNSESHKKKLIFLSRIHKGKGIENLLLAWEKLPIIIRENWTLEIIGEGEFDYVKSLHNQMEILKIQHQVKFKGPMYDEEKKLAYQSADLFVLPTYSENFGMAIAEALAYGLPVITTKGAPWEELETHNAGWWIDIGVEPLTKALIEAMNFPKAALIEMGKNGRQLIEQNYSIESVAVKMVQLYNWILNPSQPKPDFIHIK
jgi:glycosyltransferase involved in cell wall biosynthesis